jgi:hypothetical protein
MITKQVSEWEPAANHNGCLFLVSRATKQLKPVWQQQPRIVWLPRQKKPDMQASSREGGWIPQIKLSKKSLMMK